MLELSASILSSPLLELKKVLDTLQQEGIRHLHFDVCDGHFVPNLSFGPALLKHIHAHGPWIVDVHLMTEHRTNIIQAFTQEKPRSVTLHPEAGDVKHALSMIPPNCEKGLAINPQTPLESLKPYLADIDRVLVMSVEPGFGGQTFMPSSLQRIQQLLQWRSQASLNFKIGIDGGLQQQWLPTVRQHGADFAIIGHDWLGKIETIAHQTRHYLAILA